MTEWTLADAYELLAVAQSFDRRTVGDFDAEGWRRAMHGLQLEDAKQAVVEHFTTSTDWLMPAHVRDGVKRIRKDRLERRAFDWVPDADPDDPIAYQRALRAGNERAADGTEQTRDLQELPGTFRDVPKASPAAIEAAKAAVPPRRPRHRDLTHADAVADMDRMLEQQQSDNEQPVTAELMSVPDPLSPDCEQRKHQACTGEAWDLVRDEPAACSCECHA